jgi:mRNA interferase RelE/StbE
MEDMRTNPRPHGCVKLEGSDELWRIRVGSFRVVYRIDDDELMVLVARIAHRKDVYRG